MTQTPKAVCIEISQRFEMHFVEIGTDEDHVHFLIQTVPTMLPSGMVGKIKSITAREIFQKHQEIRKMLWGGNFWTSGFYLNMLGQYANEVVIKKYVQEQAETYHQIYRDQLTLF